MRSMLRCSLIMLALAIVLVDQCIYASYIDTDNQVRSSHRDLQDHVIFRPPRSACIERGGNCDHDMNCCDSTTCRCNLWGANCRCARKGLFQP